MRDIIQWALLNGIMDYVINQISLSCFSKAHFLKLASFNLKKRMSNVITPLLLSEIAGPKAILLSVHILYY